MSEEDDIYTTENLTIYREDGSIVGVLSAPLARKQGINLLEIELLKISHLTRDLLFRAMEETDNPEILRKLADKFEELEFVQQDLWRFDQNKDFHRWFDVPKCTCPKMDNADLIGCEQRIINLSCIIHGGKRNETK